MPELALGIICRNWWCDFWKEDNDVLHPTNLNASVQVGGDPAGSANTGVSVYPGGYIRASRPNDTDNIFIGYKTGTGNTPTVAITASGDAAFAGDVGIATNSPVSKLDVRGGVFGNNQEFGINLGVPDGQWMSGMFLRSNSLGQPRLCWMCQLMAKVRQVK